MGLGLQGAYGIQGGYDALAALIAQRKKDELVAQAEADKQQELRRRDAQDREQSRQFDITNARLADAEEVTKLRQDKQDKINEAGRVETSSVPGDTLDPNQIVSLVQAGKTNDLQPTPILPSLHGMINKIGESAPVVPPTASTDTGGQLSYGGTSSQKRQVKSDAITQQRFDEQMKKDDEARKQQAIDNANTQKRIDLSIASANRPMPLIMIGNDGLPHTVGEAPKGSRIVTDPNKLTAADHSMKNAAIQILPHIQEIRNMKDQLDQMGLSGPLASRWTDFVAGKIGAGEIAAGSPEGARLIGKFRTELSLLQSAAMRAHVGARGSQTFLQKIDGVTSGSGDLPSFMGNMDGLESYMSGYAHLGEDAPETPPPASSRSTPGAGLPGGPPAGLVIKSVTPGTK